MDKKIKKLNNIVKFPKSLNKLEKQVEAILFAADEPLDIETIEKRVQSTNNIKKILENLQLDYELRGINLICIKDKWSFRTSKDLASLMSLQKSTEKKLSSNHLSAWLTTSIVPVLSPDNLFGLMKGTFNPNFSQIFLIFKSSVETRI